MIFLLLFSVLPTFADSAQVYYADKNATDLERICAGVNTRESSLLCRYRLYPLTSDEKHLESLPTDLTSGSAREFALLSGLWGYRAARAPIHRTIKYGLIASRLMEKARSIDADEPYVLLIEGQSFLFRPAFAGGSRTSALERFQALRGVAEQSQGCGISGAEADLWLWYTLHKLKDQDETVVLSRLKSRKLPLLYQEFIASPP